MDANADAGRPALGTARRVTLVALAWAPLYLLWILFILSYDDGATLQGAAMGGLSSIGLAAALGLLVWWLSGRLPWPDRVRPSFYLAHLLIGSAYSATWLLGGSVFLAWRTSIPVGRLLAESRVLGWQFILGLVLYGLVAGVSYAIRIRGRLGEQERLAARAATLAAQARLNALQARLNPHFFFNALHSVGVLVREDADAAERAVEQLGDLLRYALDVPSEREVTLDEELAFTRDYIDLEQLRFGDRVSIQLDTDSAPPSSPLLPLTLQPLVENAYRHAAGVQTGSLSIRISAVTESDRLVVRVADDGPGSTLDAVVASAGSGLRSLRERLAARYAARANLKIDTQPGRGFEVTVSVPAT